MNKIASVLEHVNRAAIAGHIRPDGDCVGSCMAVYLYLKEYFPQIETDVYLQEIPLSFHMIEGTDGIKNSYEEEIEYDLFIALDSGDIERLGEAGKYFGSAKKTVCIDHHISNNGYADTNYIVPEASSTAELVYGLLEEEQITKEIAAALYLGIIHDTGVFKYKSTSSETMRIAGKLMDKGIDHTSLIDDTFYKKSYLQNQILGRALLESMLMLGGKCIISGLSKSDMDFYGVTSGDLEGVVSQLRITEGVEVAIFVYETKFQEHKVSMRSNETVDVSKVASYFGGGGHRMAAGCTMSGTFHDVINNLLRIIESQLK